MFAGDTDGAGDGIGYSEGDADSYLPRVSDEMVL